MAGDGDGWGFRRGRKEHLLHSVHHHLWHSPHRLLWQCHQQLHIKFYHPHWQNVHLCQLQQINCNNKIPIFCPNNLGVRLIFPVTQNARGLSDFNQRARAIPNTNHCRGLTWPWNIPNTTFRVRGLLPDCHMIFPPNFVHRYDPLCL